MNYTVKSKEYLFPQIQQLQSYAAEVKGNLPNLSQDWLPTLSSDLLYDSAAADLLYAAAISGGLVGAMIGISKHLDGIGDETKEIVTMVEQYINDLHSSSLFIQFMGIPGNFHYRVFKKLLNGMLMRVDRSLQTTFSQAIMLERGNYILRRTLEEHGFEVIRRIKFPWDSNTDFPVTTILSYTAPQLM